jgi:hypothetical protein
MRTDPRTDPNEPPRGDEPVDASVDDALPRVTPARRIATLGFFAAVALAAWLLFARGDQDRSAAPTRSASRASSLPPGTYRLPGITTPVSLTLPEGWSAESSVWGPAGDGIATVSTGRTSAVISIAILDVGRLRPIDERTGEPRAGPVGAGWYRGSFDRYRAAVEPRVRDRVVGQPLTWTPPPVMAWLLTYTDRGPIGVADDVVYDDRVGDLVTFAYPGPRREIFRTGAEAIALRPGVTYTFWVPRDGSGIVVGVARELGAPPGSAEWDVVRTIDIG